MKILSLADAIGKAEAPFRVNIFEYKNFITYGTMETDNKVVIKVIANDYFNHEIIYTTAYRVAVKNYNVYDEYAKDCTCIMDEIELFGLFHSFEYDKSYSFGDWMFDNIRQGLIKEI